MSDFQDAFNECAQVASLTPRCMQPPVIDSDLCSTHAPASREESLVGLAFAHATAHCEPLQRQPVLLRFSDSIHISRMKFRAPSSSFAAAAYSMGLVPRSVGWPPIAFESATEAPIGFDLSVLAYSGAFVIPGHGMSRSLARSLGRCDLNVFSKTAVTLLCYRASS